VKIIMMTGKAFNEEHREPAFVRYANGDDFEGHVTIRVEPCPNCEGECCNEYVVLRIAGHPDADRDLEVVWDKEEAERIAAAILRGAKSDPGAEPQLRRGLGGTGVANTWRHAWKSGDFRTTDRRKPEDFGHSRGARHGWQAHTVVAEPAHRRGAASRAQVPALLKCLIFGPNGRAMSPSHTRRRGRIYRYYVTREAIAGGYENCPVTSRPAGDVEGAVLGHVQKLLAAPELVARTWAAAKRESEDEITEREVTVLLADFATVWNELFPVEQARIVQLLVERVDVQEDSLEVQIRAEGLVSLVVSYGSRARGKRHDGAR
jgi:hypothetical protein